MTNFTDEQLQIIGLRLSLLKHFDLMHNAVVKTLSEDLKVSEEMVNEAYNASKEALIPLASDNVWIVTSWAKEVEEKEE